jgi:hypothetical protein
VDVSPARVLDLGAGTGSNLRYMGPCLSGAQHWLLVDYDSTLLAEAEARLSAWCQRLNCTVETRRLDLDTLDHPEIFDGRHLITASALLDLVSESWLRALASHSRYAGAAVLFALNYNGQSRCFPPEAEDEMVRALMNRHQKSDKGLGGVATGPDGAACAEQCLIDVGYQVRREASDWVLSPDQRGLQRQLMKGWAHAAVAVAPGESQAIDDWLARRLAHVESNRSRITVGHYDVAAWLP